MSPAFSLLFTGLFFCLGPLGFRADTDSNVMAAIDLSAVAANNASLLWGTYRPNLYFGTKTRLPNSLVSGLMWSSVNRVSSFEHVRHDCKQEDKMDHYGWKRHDGRTFGEQEILDKFHGYKILTTFYKQPGGEKGGHWTARISGEPLDQGTTTPPKPISLFYYFGLEGQGSLGLDTSPSKGFAPGQAKLQGRTEDLGDFTITFTDHPDNEYPLTEDDAPFPDSPSLRNTFFFGAAIPSSEIWKAKEMVLQVIMHGAQAKIDLAGSSKTSLIPAEHLLQLPNHDSPGSTLYVLQKTFAGSFSFDVSFESASSSEPIISSDDLAQALEVAKSRFDARFEDTYGLEAKGEWKKAEVEQAKSILSDMIGGIGYFHGTSLVDQSDRAYQADEDADIEEGAPEFRSDIQDAEFTQPMSLFSTTPSRPFFPRGFLWDEGFHQQLILHFDPDLTLEVLSSWFNLIDEDGWVAREQILGDEARSKVPLQFQVQYPHYANPPTLMLTVETLLRSLSSSGGDRDSNGPLVQLGSGLGHRQVNIEGNDPFLGEEGGVRKGNQGMIIAYLSKVYPKMKANFDWFRRTQQGGSLHRWGRVAPGGREVYRWRGRTLNHTLTSGLDDYPRAVPHTGELHVDLLSWVSLYARTLSVVARIVGEEEDAEEIQENYDNMLANLDALHWDEKDKSYCDLTVNGSGDSISVCHHGYITLLPLILGLIPRDSPKLGYILDIMRDPDQLWSKWGLRSLSRSDPYYGQGENYWRGPIWININYLSLSSLHTHYLGGSSPGPYEEKARELYTELRANLIRNILHEYHRTGYLWEQYSGETGQGQRTHPFVGWTGLVVNLMAEKYH